VVLPLVILRDLGGSLADVGVNSAIAAAIEVPAMIAWGYVALRLRKEVVLAIACAIFAIYFLGVAIATSVLQVMLLQGIAAIAIAALLSINISYLQDAIKGRVGLSTSLVDISRVVAVLAASGIFALNVGEDFAPLLVVAATSSALAAILLLFGGRLSNMSDEAVL
jgi:MFS transporter, SET family, sugar efflux transporter